MSSYDEALKFSGMGNVEKLKSSQYSSGMAYRLVFTSAVYSKPEILLIDEAFTFSDGAFKNKAIEKVKDIARVGGVVVMNSHDLPLVRKCCSRVILLHRGKIVKDGPPAETLDYYTKNFRNLN
jgi:ABC-type polysaccharide/polyol phosphate transport system ATPase subunit